MKQLVLSYFKPAILFFLIATAIQLQAQVKIGENPESINPFSLLELESTDKAFLFPRFSSSQRDAAFDREIAPLGLTIFNTTTNQLEVLHRDFSPTARAHSRWTPLGTTSVPTGTATPTSAATGALFFDTSQNQFMVYDGKDWHGLQTVLGNGNNLQVLTLSNDGILQLGTSTVDLNAWLENQNTSESDKQKLSYAGTLLSLENGGSVDLSNLITPPQLLQLGNTTSTTAVLELTNGGNISLQASGSLNFDTQNGRLIISVPSAQQGPFSTTNSITSNATNGYANENFVIGSAQLDSQSGPDDNNRLFFEKNTGAFRAGYDGSGTWDASNRGTASIGLGYNTKAEGNRSVALGNTTQAEAFSEIALGAYNTVATSPNPSAWNPSDRLLSVGNGQNAGNRSNALTILKSGNAGLGTETPQATLHVSGTLRLEDGNQANGFVLTSDAIGNASWQAAASGTDSQTLSVTAGTASTSVLALTGGSSVTLEAGNNITLSETGNTITIAALATLSDNDWVANTASSSWRLQFNSDESSARTATFEISDDGSLAVGQGATASGAFAFAFGVNNTASGDYSTIGGGAFNTASGFFGTVAGGANNIASGENSTVSGGGANTAYSYGEWVGGLFSSAYTASSTTAWDANDRIFAVGNGQSASNRSNALTILKSGNAGLGTETPQATLHVSGTLRLEDGNQANGFVLTSDANGNASWQAAASGASSQTLSVTTGTTSTSVLALTGGSSVTLEAGNNITLSETGNTITIAALATLSDNDWVATAASTSWRLQFNSDESTARTAAFEISDDGSLAVGQGATASGARAIALGNNNAVFGDDSTIGGGAANSSAGNFATVSGGTSNNANGGYTTVSGGSSNNASNPYGTVSGGTSNNATGSLSTVSGGSNNTSYSYGEWVGGIFSSAYAAFSTTAWNANDRIFTVGNGQSASNRSNALTILKSGNTGLGTETPQATLHVSGTLRLEDGNQANGFVLTSDANGNATWQAAASGASSQTLAFGGTNTASATTLDITDGNSLSLQASGALTFTQTGTNTLRFDVPEVTNTDSQTLSVTAGTASTSIIELVNGGAVTLEAGNNISLTESGTTISIAALATLSDNDWVANTASSSWRLQFNSDESTARTAAFEISDDGSLAVGQGATASGAEAIALGGNNTASGPRSTVSGGIFNTTSADRSTVGGGGFNFALGGLSTVSGGNANTAYSYGEWVGGIFSSDYTPASTTAWDANDRIFAVGNGQSTGNRSNALTILKSGNAGLGTETPQATLHVSGTLRLEDGNQANGFVLTSDANGNATWQNPTGGLFDGDNDTRIDVDRLNADDDTIRFTTGNSERITINPTGQLLFTNPGSYAGIVATTAVLGISGVNHARLRLTAGDSDTRNPSLGASIDLHGTSAAVKAGDLDLVPGSFGGANGNINFWVGNASRGVWSPNGLTLTTTLAYQNGTEAAGRVLTSDATGNASWQDPMRALFDGDNDTGIDVDRSNADDDTIRLITQGSERITINPTGQLLFTNPGGPYSGGATTAVLGIDGANHARLRLTAGNTDSQDDSQGASIDLHGNTATANRGRLDLVGGSSASGTNPAIAFYTNSTGGGGGQAQRLVITGNGNVGIGTSAPTEALHVVGNATKTGGGTGWSATSDKRLKENIHPFTRGLKEILQINPVFFKYTDKSGLNGDTNPEENIGVIAQELQKVIPEAISVKKTHYMKDGSTMKDVLQLSRVDAMWFALINAVKEQQEIIGEQKAKIEAILTRLNALENKED